MVFDPTFEEISKEATELPDLTGDTPDLDAADIDEGALDGEDAADLPEVGAE